VSEAASAGRLLLDLQRSAGNSAASVSELDALMYQFAAIAAIAGEGVGMLLSTPARTGNNLGFVTKMSATERSTALVEALTAMEPGHVALRTGLTPRRCW
jgi:hypothetical protein